MPIKVTIHATDWFLGVDATFEAITTLIVFLVAFASFRLYKLTGERRYLQFSSCFGILALSFFLRALADTIVEYLFSKGMINAYASPAGVIFFVGYAAHILLGLIAYVFIAAVTSKVPWRVTWFLMALTLSSLALAKSVYLIFYLMATILLALITLNYWYNYRRKPKPVTFLVFFGFLLVALAQPQFIAEAYVHKLFYVSAHITQFVGYAVLFIALLKVLLKR